MKQITPITDPSLILAGDVYFIDVDEARLKPNPFQPRVNFNQAELDDLAASIREHGVLQPILVRPIYADAAKKKIKWYEIVFGERRVRATRQNGTPQIRATVRDLSDVESAEIALLENLNSQALTDYEEAFGIQMLWKEFEKAGQPMSLSKMAKRLKTEDGHFRSVTFVQKRMTLVGLDEEFLEVAKKHRNVMSSLFEIAKVKDKEIKTEALAMVEAGSAFRPVQAFIQKKLADKKTLQESSRPPDTETAQRASTHAATGGGNVSRGIQVKGNTSKQAFEVITSSLSEITIKLDTVDSWENLLTEKQKTKLIPTLRELATRLEAKAK